MNRFLLLLLSPFFGLLRAWYQVRETQRITRYRRGIERDLRRLDPEMDRREACTRADGIVVDLMRQCIQESRPFPWGSKSW